MSDGSDPSSIAVGAGVTAGIGLAFAFVRTLFARNVSAVEKQLSDLQSTQKDILLEVRSMHDEQTRQRGEQISLGKDVETLKFSVKAAHERLDAFIAVPPRAKR